MSYPPPPPDRMHLQYRPVPPQPPQAGPGGAYGPPAPAPGQPVPGPLPGMSTGKPGTVTGIQVILWTLMALGAIGDLFSVYSLVVFFDPFTLLALAWAVYSTVQALASGVHLTRGKRWAWIWSLVSAVIGLVFATAGIVFGIIYVEAAYVALIVGVVLGALYGTLLGLLCSKSARQWILMHRIQRGEVALPGGAGAFSGGTGAFTGSAEAPRRPDAKPGAVTFAVLATVLLLAGAAWVVLGAVRSLIALHNGSMNPGIVALKLGATASMTGAAVMFAALVCGPVTALGIHRGSFGARVFTIVWTPFLFLAWGFLTVGSVLNYLDFRDLALPGEGSQWAVLVIRDVAILALIAAVFIAALLPGVRAWTPGKPAAPLVVVLPGPPQQSGPYGRQQYPPRPPGAY